MKHTKYCQFHGSTGNHYSSECSSNPANLKTQETQKKITKDNHQDPTINQHHQNTLHLNIQENLKQANTKEK